VRCACDEGTEQPDVFDVRHIAAIDTRLKVQRGKRVSVPALHRAAEGAQRVALQGCDVDGAAGWYTSRTVKDTTRTSGSLRVLAASSQSG
jgi:hypothetical protein